MLHHTRRMAGGCRLGERAGVSRFVADLPAVACPGPVELRQPAGTLRFTPRGDMVAIYICAYRPFGETNSVSVDLNTPSTGSLVSMKTTSSGSGYARIYRMEGLTPGVEATVNWLADHAAPESAVLVIDTIDAPVQLETRNAVVGGGLSGYSITVLGPCRAVTMGIANNMAIGALAPRVDRGEITYRCSQSIPLGQPAQPGEASLGLIYTAEFPDSGSLGVAHNPTWGSQQNDGIFTSYCSATYHVAANAEINTTTTAV